MLVELSIDGLNGNIVIGDDIVLMPMQSQGEVAEQVAAMVSGARDHGNGYEWLYLTGLTFGGQAASLSLGFHNHHLDQAAWTVRLPNAPTEEGWPTRQAIDEEIKFVRGALKTMGLDTRSFSWGEIWSQFDAKAFIASNGLRYSAH